MTRITKWGPLLAWTAFIFFLSAQPQLPAPKDRWLDFVFEKSAHAFEFAVLAALTLRALAGARRPSRQAVLVAVVLTYLYALSDELHQTFVPGRSADWSDVVFDWLGGAFGIWLWLRWRRAVDERRSTQSL